MTVRWSVYLDLLRAYGYKYACVSVLFVLGFHFAYNFSYTWLAQWSDDHDLANFTTLPAASGGRWDRNWHYIKIYAGLGVVQTACCMTYSAIMQYRHVVTSRVIHANMLDALMRTPMSFFDTTPMGRILNRFSQDLDVLDSDLFLELEVVIEHGLFAVGITVVICVTFPPFVGVLVPLIIIFYFIQQFYIRSSCQLQRIASNNRSPVFAHFSETLSGVGVIRAHQAQNRFIHDSESKVDAF
ncbi:multidrug resistance-associated protein 1, partial [Aplysia californica]|uniref:Multidrug resistance-associated protein 1 n=1 Tax=Aplysia californica TaxID=6500 RepID=A0ABM1AC28_APLCA